MKLWPTRLGEKRWVDNGGLTLPCINITYSRSGILARLELNTWLNVPKTFHSRVRQEVVSCLIYSYIFCVHVLLFLSLEATCVSVWRPSCPSVNADEYNNTVITKTWKSNGKKRNMTETKTINNPWFSSCPLFNWGKTLLYFWQFCFVGR